MFTRTDTLTKYFQCLMGHFAMLFIVIFNQTAHLEAAVNGGIPVAEEAKIGFVVCLVLTKLTILVEFASLALELPGVLRSLYSSLSHTIATCLILLFIYDSHPPSHFWILFVFFSLLPCCLALSVIIRKLSPQKNE